MTRATSTPPRPGPAGRYLDSHPLDSDSDRDESLAHDTSSDDDPVDDLDGLANHRVLHIHGTVGICEVHLLGTAHVSRDSVATPSDWSERSP